MTTRKRRDLTRRAFVRRGAAWGAAATLGSWVSPLSARAAVVFADTFARKSRRKGWGAQWFNQRYGNRWGIAKKRGFYDLPDSQPGAGGFNPNPVLALNNDVVNVDLQASISTTNENARFGLVARASSYGTYYGCHAEGTRLVISRFNVNKAEELGAGTITQVASGRSLNMRLIVEGTGPVKIRARVWPAGKKEPSSFQAEANDDTPPNELTKKGPFGFLFLPDESTGRGTRFKVSRFKAQSTETKTRTRPHVTYAFSGRAVREPSGSYRTTLVAKTDIPAGILFEVGTSPDLSSSDLLEPTETTKKLGTARVSVSGIAAGTSLYWRIVARSVSKARGRSKILEFRAPAPGSAVSFAFGSCSHLYPISRSYAEAAKLQPNVFVHLGDLGYAQNDKGAAMALRADCYQDRWTRMLDRPSLVDLHWRTSWVMLQDDHDYGSDNSNRETIKPFTIEAWQAMNANDDAGLGYFDVRMGDVHLFCLDVHRYADRQEVDDSPTHTLLGETQKRWLKEEMGRSDAPLLVVMTPLPFWGAGLGSVTWKGAFAIEGAELLASFHALQDASRHVIICSGNAHAQYIARHPGVSGGKDIFEFVSSGTDRIDSGTATPLKADARIDPSRALKKVDGFGYVELTAVGGQRKVRIRSVASNPQSLGRQDCWPALELDL